MLEDPPSQSVRALKMFRWSEMSTTRKDPSDKVGQKAR